VAKRLSEATDAAFGRTHRISKVFNAIASSM
jgi:hypothetical protein